MAAARRRRAIWGGWRLTSQGGRRGAKHLQRDTAGAFGSRRIPLVWQAGDPGPPAAKRRRPHARLCARYPNGGMPKKDGGKRGKGGLRHSRRPLKLSKNLWGWGFWGRSAVCNGRAASARGAFLTLPCSLGFRLASSATGSPRLPPPGCFHRIWRHKVNCPEGTREGPLGGVGQIRLKPCVVRVSLHGTLAAP